MRLIPVMLALLLALSPGAVAVQASAPTEPAPSHPSATGQSPSAATDAVAAQVGADTVRPSPAGNTTTVMTLGTDPAQAALDTPSVALGDSLAGDRSRFRTRFSVGTLDQQLENAESDEQKKQILNRYRYQVENRIISLQATERQATRQFSNGTISKGEYVRTLGRIDAEASEIRELTEAMQTRAEAIPRFGMETEANTLKGKLVALQGPVRDRVTETVRGQSSSTRVYVAAAETGVVLSTIVDGQYVREIVRADRRNPGASNPVGMPEAQREIVEQHQWAWNNSKSRAIDGFYGTTNVYRMQFQHTQGELFVYYDGGTESIFKEVQYKRLTGTQALPPGPGVTNASENLTLVVNRTYPGGPLRVKLTNETGAPLQGRITVTGEQVGRTGADGTLWTLGPAEQFQVTATDGDRTVNVTATPVESS